MTAVANYRDNDSIGDVTWSIVRSRDKSVSWKRRGWVTSKFETRVVTGLVGVSRSGLDERAILKAMAGAFR